MRKSDKKIENQIRTTLTEVCDTALKEYKGFQWLTHYVNYDRFPQTLRVVCIFNTNDELISFMATKNGNDLSKLIQIKLLRVGISLKKMSNHIVFDTEENCNKEHNGKWADRLG